VTDVGVVVASLPDLLRLVAVPLFAWAAWRDIETRRIPGRVWWPVVALGVGLLVVDATTAAGAVGAESLSLFLVQAGLSLGFVAPLAYLFWRVAGFGGADAKGIMALAVLFPTYPQYLTKTPLQALGAPGTLPVVETSVPVFAFTVLTNAVVVGALYPLGLVVYNAARGDLASIMFLGRPVAVERLPRTYGRLLERADGTAGRGLDLDALRMYLRWRGTTLAEVRADPERLRDPASLPETPNDPGDGAVTDGGHPVDADDTEREDDPDPVDHRDGAGADTGTGTDTDTDGATGTDTDGGTGTDTDGATDAGTETDTDGGTGAKAEADGETGAGTEPAADDQTGADDRTPADPATDHDDPWGAEAFLADTESGAYGTSAAELRDGLELLSRADRVWISPGLPFMVPLFLGLVVGLTYGDVLFGILGAAGVV
jgi:preflagellin peptidase FlaK